MLAACLVHLIVLTGTAEYTGQSKTIYANACLIRHIETRGSKPGCVVAYGDRDSDTVTESCEAVRTKISEVWTVH